MKRLITIMLAIVCALSAVCIISCSGSGNGNGMKKLNGKTFSDLLSQTEKQISEYTNYKVVSYKESKITTATTETVVGQTDVKVLNGGRFYSSQSFDNELMKSDEYSIWFEGSSLKMVTGSNVGISADITAEQLKTKKGIDVNSAKNILPELASDYKKNAEFVKSEDGTYYVEVELSEKDSKQMVKDSGITDDGSEVTGYVYYFVFNSDGSFNCLKEAVGLRSEGLNTVVSSVKSVTGNVSDSDIPSLPSDVEWTDVTSEFLK